MHVVVVTWHDAHETSGDFATAADIDHTPKTQHTVGFLLRSDRVGVTIATERSDDGGYRTTNFIPRGMIVRVRRLR